jgi:Tol biopolymer transport system component
MLVLSAASADAAFPGGDGKIAFTRDNFRQGTLGIFTIAPEDGGQQKIGPEYGYSPSWSADGQKIVFVGYSGGDFGQDDGEFSQDIYVMNDDGSEREDLTASRAYDILPAFSPSGDEIVFSKAIFSRRSEQSDLFLMDSDGANKRQLTDSPRAFEYEADWQPVLLPNP